MPESAPSSSSASSPASSPAAAPESRPGPLLALIGPTAVGKTSFALDLAEALEADIVSMDSMQVYRRMDIGTAKPTAAERARVAHHGLDLVEPHERYDVRRFVHDLEQVRVALAARGRRALLVGGAGLYLRALERGLFEGPDPDPILRAELNERARVEGSPALHAELSVLDPTSAERIHPNDAKRVVRALEVGRQTGRALSDWQREWGGKGRPATEVPARPLRLVGLERSRAALEARSLVRIRAMLAAGWIEEASAIRASSGFGPTSIQALGYRDVLAHVDGQLDRPALEARLVLRTRQFVRRQSTWFRSFPETRWVDPDAAGALDEARRTLEDATPRQAAGSGGEEPLSGVGPPRAESSRPVSDS